MKFSSWILSAMNNRKKNRNRNKKMQKRSKGSSSAWNPFRFQSLILTISFCGRAVAARNNLPDKPPGSTSASGSQTLAKPKPQQVPSVKKTGGIKSALKGVVVKKRKTTDASLPIMVSSKLVSGKPKETETGDADEPSKKRKVS